MLFALEATVLPHKTKREVECEAVTVKEFAK